MLPFGFSLSPWCYHTLSEAKAAFLRSKGIPALAYLDDSWVSDLQASHGLAAREQWLAVGEATHVAMLISLLFGQFLCDFRQTGRQQYLGIVCDSDIPTFRVPQDKLDKLQQLPREALAAGHLSFHTLQRIARRCMSMTVVIRPASLWTHAMFAVVAELDNSGRCSVDLTHDSRADLVTEFKQWQSITSTSQEGPWQRARRFATTLTKGSSDASSVAWGGVVNTTSGTSPAGGVFPPD